MINAAGADGRKLGSFFSTTTAILRRANANFFSHDQQCPVASRLKYASSARKVRYQV